jgi:hypothetical protein
MVFQMTETLGISYNTLYKIWQIDIRICICICIHIYVCKYMYMIYIYIYIYMGLYLSWNIHMLIYLYVYMYIYMNRSKWYRFPTIRYIRPAKWVTIDVCIYICLCIYELNDCSHFLKAAKKDQYILNMYYMNVYIYTYIYIYTFQTLYGGHIQPMIPVFIHTFRRIYAHINIYMCIQTYIYIYIITYTFQSLYGDHTPLMILLYSWNMYLNIYKYTYINVYT